MAIKNSSYLYIIPSSSFNKKILKYFIIFILKYFQAVEIPPQNDIYRDLPSYASFQLKPEKSPNVPVKLGSIDVEPIQATRAASEIILNH